jgi:hypothetical protein
MKGNLKKMKAKTVRDVLTDYIKKNKMNGLVDPFDDQCACYLENLANCDLYCLNCTPAIIDKNKPRLFLKGKPN